MTCRDTQRHRVSDCNRMMPSEPPMLVDEALCLLLHRAYPVVDIEIVDTYRALGRVLASDQVSTTDAPRFDNSAMDGYALRSQDTVEHETTHLHVTQSICAGRTGQSLPPGCAAQIFTGAPVPTGADTVIMQEECAVDRDQLLVGRFVRPGENIRRRASDIIAGSTVLGKGVKIGPPEMALAASIGLATLPVYRQLRVAILSTGNELVSPGSPLKKAQIYSSNRYALVGLLQGMGCQINDLGITPDDLSVTRNTLLEAANGADLIITSGGVSVGEEDYVRRAMADVGQLYAWQVAIKPGKPLAFGSIQETPIVGLPGNPVALFITFLVFVRPFLKHMQGISDTAIRAMQVPAGFEWTGAKNRREYLCARLCIDSGGMVTSKLYAKRGSDILTAMTWAHGLVEIPERQPIKLGQPVRYLPFTEMMS